ncbi:Uncharacterised protein [Yersinia frederiksenii]|uniref:Uncharacterized protein n=2 Tax=Yersinia frederiksenii TaxID=29484 RepID=A0A380PWL6_YERFR|nr:Uncharacterised protein [Yersinia frederiksenii]
MDKHTIAHLKTVMSTEQLIDFLADQLAAAELELIKPLPIGELIHRLEGQTYEKWFGESDVKDLRERAEAAEARLVVPVKLQPHVFVEDEFCKVHNYTLWRCAEAIRAAGYPAKWDGLATTTPEPLVPGDFMLAPKNPSIAMLTVLGLTGSFESMTEKYQKMLALAQATSRDID